ncbi:MAG: hypothetical protein U0936_03460 [Planctomycetaceae bacterium]
MHGSVSRTSNLVLLSLMVLFAGCNDDVAQQDANAGGGHAEHDHAHGHGHAPTTSAEGLTELTSLRNTIRDAFAANDMDKAHDPLHEVGDVLLAIPELAKTENVDSEKLASIQKAVDTLMDAFGRVDKTMHGQEGSTYAEESATIDAAVVELESLLNSSASPRPDDATPKDSASATSETPAAETASPVETPATSTPN